MLSICWNVLCFVSQLADMHRHWNPNSMLSDGLILE